MTTPIRVCLPGHAPVDLAIDASADTTTWPAAVAQFLGVDPDGQELVARPPALTAPGTLTAGATLGFGPQPAATDSTWELVTQSGPDAGRRWFLEPGDHHIGRSATATIRPSDPTISRVHAAIAVLDDGCVITDTESKSGTTVDGEPLAPTAQITRTGATLQLGATTFRLEPMSERPCERTPDGRIAHNRPPRIPPFAPRPITVNAPPVRPGRMRLTLVSALVPVAGGIVLWLVLRNPAALLMSAFAPVAMLANWMVDKRRGTKQWSAQRREYRAHLAAAEQECREQAARWRASSAHQFPGAVTLLTRARRGAPECWDRRPDDADFLVVRIADDDPLAETPVMLGAGGAPELRAEAERALQAASRVAGIPVALNLDRAAVGIAGDARVPTVQWVTSALASTHSPRDVRIAVCAGDDMGDEWAFAAWLPHVDATDIVDAPSLVARTPERTATLLAQLEQLVANRRTHKQTDASPRIVVVIPDVVACDRALIAQLAEHGPTVGVSVVAAAVDASGLPGACSSVVSTGTQHSMVRTADGIIRTALTFDALRPDALDEHARLLAGLRDASTAASPAHLPSFVRLGDCLDGTDAATIQSRWAASDAGADLAAPIGLGLDGPVLVDLRAHGPHALIAGTTGSGKSALLQSLVGAFAACHPPDRLTFVLIDYKGGAAFGPCVAFPHTAGMVTDLDDGRAQRVLVALDAELRRRETILRDAGVADLAALERLDMQAAPPNVCIVIDEFAALVREVPHFVDGMVDLAQRGRSLGMHLILATQKPAGVVNDRIRANTGLRIALRTTDASDSIDVIGSDAAAHISRTRSGRAVVSLSPNEQLPVQSAFVGAPSGNGSGPRAVTRFDTGRDLPDATTAPCTPPDRGPTDLDALVDAVQCAATNTARDRAPAPWLEPLPAQLPLDALKAMPDVGPRPVVAVGLRDEPATQTQPVHTIAFDRVGAFLITGPAASGKSGALATIATAACHASGPDAVQLHLLDNGTGALRMLDALPHFASAAAIHDLDATTRLLEFIARQIEVRRTLLHDHGVTDWTELQASGAPVPARLFVLLDGLGSFLHTYERLDAGRWQDLLIRLVGDGRACGIHWCIASERRSGLPPTLVAHCTERIDLGGDPDAPPQPAGRRPGSHSTTSPGRGVTRGHDVQLAHVGSAPSRAAAELALRNLAAQHTAPARPVLAPYVLPERINLAALPPCDPPNGDPFALTTGVTELGAPAMISLATESLVICGPRGSGRSNALETVAQRAAPDTRVVRVDVRRDGVEHATAALALLFASLTSERPAFEPECPSRTVLLVDDADLLVEGEAATHLEAIIKLGSRQPIRVVLACDTFTVTRSFAGWVAELRRTRRALVLQPAIANDGDAFGVRLRTRPGATFPPGRGFLIDRGTATLVQCARAE